MAHNFAEKEIRPVAWDYDRDSTWPQDIIEKAWEVGLMNTHIPEEYGSPGLDYLSGCIIEEEMGWGCSGIGTSLMCNGLATAPIAIGGSEEIKKKYLGMLTEEPKLASFCLTEPDAGSDVSGMRTSAVKMGDEYVINGSKCFITNGGYANYYTDYSKERVQFGVPIAMHQAIQFMIADMATKIEAARLLVWQSASLLDQGKRNTLASSHAKRFAADTAMEVAVDAVQVYGGYGFIKEYPVEKLMRDAKIMQLYEGTSQIQRLVIAREVLMPRHVDEPQPETTKEEVEAGERAATEAPAAV